MPPLIGTAVSSLLQARRVGRPVAAVNLPDAAAAYTVQAGVARELNWFADSQPGHWKSGGKSRDAVMTHAPLPPAGVWPSPARAGSWLFFRRGIEAEIALRIGEPVDAARVAALDGLQAKRLIDRMCVSIEIVDSRWVEADDASGPAKLADQQSHGALVLGDWVPFVDTDWATQACHVQIGAQAVRTFRGTHAMADPAFVLLPWLRHATRDGAVVPAGTAVTTGTWCGLIDALEGDDVQVVFEGIGEARVAL